MDQVWSLIERDDQLQAIEAWFSQLAVAGVVLVGVPGAGKTRLARAALARLERGDRRSAWVSGSRSAATVPFGAVAHLLPPKWSGSGDPVATLRAVVEQVAGWGGRKRTVLCVDDAHLLDDGSATVVSQIATQGAAYVVLTIDGSATVADALVALWKDGAARRVEVPPLSSTAVDRLLDMALAGPLDGLSRRRIHAIAAGNPLLLRELVQAGLDGGTLRRRYGLWRQHGDPAGTPRLTQLMADRLAALDPAVYAVLEVAVCAGPLPLWQVEGVTERAAVATAERAGLVRVDGDGPRARLRTAHPLCAAVVKAALPASRATAIWQKLADAVTDDDLTSDDLVCAAQWQVAAGRVTRPELLLPAARLAYDRHDLELAERLVRLARETVPCGQADRLLADILEHRGRSAAAAEVLPPRPDDGDPGLTEWALTSATVAYWGHGQVERAEKVLDLAATEPGYELAEALRARIQLFDGRCDEAMALADRLTRADGVPAEVVVRVAGAGAAAAGLLGRPDQLDALALRGKAAAVELGARGSRAAGRVSFGEGVGLLSVGSLGAAVAVASDGYRTAVSATHPASVVGGWAMLCGLVSIARGRAGEAVRSLTEAAVLLEDQDSYRMLRPTLSALAAATAMTGDAEAAAGWLGRAEAAPAVSRLLGAWEELDRAWVLAAIGDLSRARDRAMTAAEYAGLSRQPMVEARALYDAARLGAARAVQHRLAELAASTRGPLVPAYARAAGSLAASDAAGLARAASAFHDLGYALLAAEMCAAAAREQTRAGRPNHAAQLAERMTAYLSECEVDGTPLLSGHRISMLTSRERQVALLARQHSSREIAKRLGLALNTVNNYLARAYLKLGVTSRRELAAVIEVDGPAGVT